MALSKEEKQQIKDNLKGVFGSAYLLCDGYLVSAQKAQHSETKLAINIYVDGYFKGKWMLRKDQHEEARRFYPTHKKRHFTDKEMKVLKIKSEDQFYYFKRSHFSTANAFVNHISKHNESIQIISYKEYKSRLAKKEEANEN